MNYSVLLVEDNSSFRRVLADTLHAHFATMNIEEVDNGEDALVKAGDLCPDMIFMDINLPGENGLEATRKIKMRHEHTLVVILTSYDLPEYRHQAFRNGADYFLSKEGDSVMVDIIMWIEKAMTDKNTQTWQERVTASHQPFLRQCMSGIRPLCRMLDLSVCLFSSARIRCSVLASGASGTIMQEIIPRIARIGVV